MTSLAKADAKILASEIWKKLISGDNDEDVMDLLGLDQDTYEAIRKTMLDEQAQSMRTRAPEHTYVEYVLWQHKGVADLTSIIEEQKRKTSPNANAMVAAIKVRGDIYDKIIAKGQEFGVLKKAPDTKLVLGGHFVADLTSDKLRTQITESIRDMEKLMKRYGDVPMTDVDPGSLHHGPKLLTDSSTMEATVVIEAPPAKDDMLAVPARTIPSGPKALKGKGNKASKSKPTCGTKTLGARSEKVKEENRAKKSKTFREMNFEDW